MKKRKLFILNLLASSLFLSSCIFDFGNITITIPKPDTGSDTSDTTTTDTDTSSTGSDTSTPPIQEGFDNYYRAEVVDEHFNYQDILKTSDLNSIPTPHNELNILVIPIEFTDYPFSNQTIADLDTVFNGEPEETNYWESVASFYRKSSFGNVDLTFTIADIYQTNLTAHGAAQLTANYTWYFSSILLRRAVDDYKTKNGSFSTKQFDQDNDGHIDAVWMIYSCPNAGKSQTIANISEDYWAYVYWDYNQPAVPLSPTASVYAWASYDFMYYHGNKTRIDAHTYIHENGHLFGLDDYYNYDDNSLDGPMGGVDMMDHNVIDHNVWSKMSLGWIKPYVVTGDAIITIEPSQVNGDAIILANNWNGTSFDEFLMMELYTPTGLNQLDSEVVYYGAYPRGFTRAGVRLYHVDSRLGLFGYYGNFKQYGHPEGSQLTTPNNEFYDVAHSNTPSFTFNGNRLLHMVQAGKTNTYQNGAKGKNSDLFRTDHEFTMSEYANFFNDEKLNNGEELDYKIEFLEVTDESATIKFIKL